MKVRSGVFIDEDFEHILISAERYAIGRQSYLPPDTIAYIRYLIPRLSVNTLYIMYSDITEEQHKYVRMCKDLPYGDEWGKLAQDINKEYQKKKEEPL